MTKELDEVIEVLTSLQEHLLDLGAPDVPPEDLGGGWIVDSWVHLTTHKSVELNQAHIDEALAGLRAYRDTLES